MKATIIQAHNTVVLTTSQDVATVAVDTLKMKHGLVTVQESTLTHDFCILSCQLLHIHTNMIGIMAYVQLSENMIIQLSAGIIYDNGNISLSDLVAMYGNKPIQSDGSLNILRPLITGYVDSNYKPQIHQFYEQKQY